MDYRQFLHELFDTKPDNHYINIWILPHKLSRFFLDIDQAADYVATFLNKKIDVYIACGTTDKKLSKTRRGKKNDITGIPAFYMDIDFLTSIKPNCPKDINEVLTIVKGFGWDPNIIVLTGNGCQCWWVFKEFWDFKNKQDRFLAEALNTRLQNTIKEKALEYGWHLDSTQDITRVLRLPGTFNHKDKRVPKPTSIYESSPFRYSDPENDFDEYLLKPDENFLNPVIDNNQVPTVQKDLKINANASLPQEKFELLYESDEKFIETWNQDLPDLKDPSPSGYSMSLANMAACVGWDDDEICELISAFYIKHGHDLSKLHPRKLQLTIQNARIFAAKEEVNDYVSNVAIAQDTEYEQVVDPDGDKARQATCKILKLDIVKIVQFKQESSAAYRMYLKDGTQVEFKNTESLLNKTKFANIIFERVKVGIVITATEWKICKKNFEKFMIVHDTGSVTTHDRMKIWLERYLQEKKPKDIIESLEDYEPFVHQGHWWVYPNKWKNWVIQAVGENKTEEGLELDLNVISAEKTRFTKTRISDGARKTIWPYKIPLNIIYPPPMAVSDEFDFPVDNDTNDDDEKEISIFDITRKAKENKS